MTLVDLPRFTDPFTGAAFDFEGAAPLEPPSAWFSREAADEAPERLMVFPGGRVAGVVAPAGRCLLNGSRECWTAPRPRTAEEAEYPMAHGGFAATAEGDRIRIAVIGGGKGHADPLASASVAQKFYADTSTQLMRGRYHWSDKAGGVTFVGALWPWVTPEQVAVINASPASIDYRWVEDEGDHRLVGACLVNIGGLPTRWRATRTASAIIMEPERPPAFIGELGVSGGTMVALRIDAPQLALGQPSEQMHLTLGFFGDASNYQPEVQAAAVEAVAAAVEAYGQPLLLEVSAVALMGPPDDTVTALLMQGDDLTALREVLCGVAEMAGLDADTKYPCWTPHVTVGPYDPATVEAALTLRGTLVSPPSVVVAFGSDDWTEIELPRVGRPLETVTFIGTDLDEGNVAAACTDCGVELCSDCNTYL